MACTIGAIHPENAENIQIRKFKIIISIIKKQKNIIFIIFDKYFIY
jgi:hypothetical protein